MLVFLPYSPEILETWNFKFQVLQVKQKNPNSFFRFLGESTARQSVYGVIWPLLISNISSEIRTLVFRWNVFLVLLRLKNMIWIVIQKSKVNWWQYLPSIRYWALLSTACSCQTECQKSLISNQDLAASSAWHWAIFEAICALKPSAYRVALKYFTSCSSK